MLLDKNGYIKLTDFGLSRTLDFEDEKAMSVCGTPEYLAPEVIKKQGHTKTVDWWCLGCIVYEMVTGFPPYRSQNRMELFESILYQPLQVPNVPLPPPRPHPSCRTSSCACWRRTRRTGWEPAVPRR